jgi:hypothetical protein
MVVFRTGVTRVDDGMVRMGSVDDDGVMRVPLIDDGVMGMPVVHNRVMRVQRMERVHGRMQDGVVRRRRISLGGTGA